MTAYQWLSLIQFFFILICGISVLDYGVDAYDENEENGLGFNHNLFKLTCDEHDEDPEAFDCENVYWGIIQFWGYCIILVGLAHFLKVLTVKDL